VCEGFVTESVASQGLITKSIIIRDGDIIDMIFNGLGHCTVGAARADQRHL
jgi:hypothetical protein